MTKTNEYGLAATMAHIDCHAEQRYSSFNEMRRSLLSSAHTGAKQRPASFADLIEQFVPKSQRA